MGAMLMRLLSMGSFIAPPGFPFYRRLGRRLLAFGLLGLATTAQAATYNFSSDASKPACSFGGWGGTNTCNGAVTLNAGDIILPAAAITITAKAGFTLGGNNAIGSTTVAVNLVTTYGSINTSPTSTIHGNLTTSSGSISLNGTTVFGSITSQGNITLTNSTVTGSLTTDGNLTTSGGQVGGNVTADNGVSASNGTAFGGSISVSNGSVSLAGGSVGGSISGSNGVTTTNGTVIGGNVVADNGAVSLAGGSVGGSVYSDCCTVTLNNTNVANGVGSGRISGHGGSSTVTIIGGTISGAIFSKGGNGISISGATVTSGSITSTNVPIVISNSTIGSAGSLVNVTSNNTVTISNGSVIYGNVTAASWQDPATVVDASSVVHGVCTSNTSSTQSPGSYYNRCDGGVVSPDHLLLVHSGSGVTCAASSVTVYACSGADASGTCPANTTGVSGTITAGSVSVPFTIAAGSSSTTIAVPVTTAQTVTLGRSTGTTTCWNGSNASCSLTFSDAGFIFTTAANGAATTIPSQIAGVAGGNYYLRAVKTNTATKACESALAGTTSVNMAYQCIDPVACYGQNMLSLNGGGGSTVIARNNGSASVSSYTALTLTFDANGNAPFTLNHADVGKIQLYASKAASGALLKSLSGASNSFVVKPYGFKVESLSCGSNTSAASGAFCPAGENFTATVKAVAYSASASNHLGAITPSFGQEATAQTVSLLPDTLVLPAAAGGVTGTMSATLGSFSGGSGNQATATLAWSEVGALTIKPAMDYLSSGDLSAAGISDSSGFLGGVGRFYPHHFTLSAGAVTAACGGTSGFTYMDEAKLQIAFTLEAQNKNSLKTSNYFYAASGGYPVGSVAISAENNNAGSDLGPRLSGLGTVTWASGQYGVSASTAKFARLAESPVGTPHADGPYDKLLIGVRVSDSDGAQVAGLDMNATTATDCATVSPACTAKKIATNETRVRFGRLHMANAYGSEVLPLAVFAQTEYYNGSGWLLSGDDGCTVLSQPSASSTAAELAAAFPDGSLAAYYQNAASRRYTLGATASGGNLNFVLAAPGTGNTGYVDIAVTAPGHLLLSGMSNNVTARATFGIYRRNNRIIYRRERY